MLFILCKFHTSYPKLHKIKKRITDSFPYWGKLLKRNFQLVMYFSNELNFSTVYLLGINLFMIYTTAQTIRMMVFRLKRGINDIGFSNGYAFPYVCKRHCVSTY